MGCCQPFSLPTGSSSFPSPALPSPDPSLFWQIGLSLTFHPFSEGAKPLSDLIIFHFCLIVHILLLAEETSSCLGRGREGHPALHQPQAFGSVLHLLALWFKPPNLLEVQGRVPKKQLWHHPVFFQWGLSCSALPHVRRRSPATDTCLPHPLPPPPLPLPPLLHPVYTRLCFLCMYFAPLFKWHQLL